MDGYKESVLANAGAGASLSPTLHSALVRNTPLTAGVSRSKEAKKAFKIQASTPQPLEGGLASAANSGVPQKVASKNIKCITCRPRLADKSEVGVSSWDLHSLP